MLITGVFLNRWRPLGHRDTVKTASRGQHSCGCDRQGNPVYALHVGPALFSVKHEAADSVHDPSRMEPKERKDWYQSENERIKLEKGAVKTHPR